MAAYNPQEQSEKVSLERPIYASIAELARAQGVGPLDVKAILGTWPGEPDDGFEEAIDELRHGNLALPHRSVEMAYGGSRK